MGGNSVKCFCLPSAKGPILQGKCLSPFAGSGGGRGNLCAGKQIGSYKSCLPCNNDRNEPSVSSPLHKIKYGYIIIASTRPVRQIKRVFNQKLFTFSIFS